MRLKLRHKYGAKRTKRGDINFPSKLEAECWSVLNKLKQSGQLLFVLRQIGIDVPGGRHFVDFMVFSENEAWLIEAKGKDLNPHKRASAENEIGCQIHVAKKPEDIFYILFGDKKPNQN